MPTTPTLALPRLRGRAAPRRHAPYTPSPASGGGLGWGHAPTQTSPRFLLRRRVVAALAGEDLEAGHAHRDPHLDLLANEAPVDVVGDLAADLDAAVHWPGMHDQGVGPGELQLGVIEPEEMEVFAGRGHEGAVHPLHLQPQHHH